MPNERGGRKIIAMPSEQVLLKPRLAPMIWLTETAAPVCVEISDGLRRTLFRRMSSLISGSLVGLIIIAILLYRNPIPAFFAWAAVDTILVLFRFAVIGRLMRILRDPSLRRPRDTLVVDAFIAGSVLWCAQIGVGAFLCMSLGDPVLAVFGTMLSTGIVGAMCARNPGSPRMVKLQMILIIAPYAAGAAMGPEPWLWPIALIAPLYLWGTISINRELHIDYLKMLMAQQESSHLALHCSLTGLPNRSSFKARLKAAERNASVLFLDLDGFKAVNDQHGHPAGDALLTAVGERIRGCVPDPADVARLGGDEFAILVHADDERTIAAIATRLIAEVARPYALPTGLVVRVGLSIGIATRRDADTDPMLLLPEADQALYEAKRAGKGTYRWFQPANDADLSSQVRELRDMLPKAQTDREHGFEASLSVTRA